MRQDTLSRQIAANVLKKQRPADLNRAAFLALRDDICTAMADGWPVKRIWETLRDQGKIGFSYPAFTGYVNRLILADQRDQKAPNTGTPVKPPKGKPQIATKKPPETPKPPVETPKPTGTWNYDPIAKKEDLLG